MKLSVIVPCYNAERFLGPCVASLLSQDMPDFEALLIDDGSSDGTLDAARALAQTDPRLCVLHQGNAGVSAARNLGLSRAKGEWVTFVDADDLLPRDAFSTLLDAAGDGVDVVVGAHEIFGEGMQTQAVRPDTGWAYKRGEARKRAAALRLIEGDSVLNIMCGKLVRRSLIEREGLRLAREVAVAEDALFNLEAVLLARGVAYVDKPVYRYRMHDQSAMHRQRKSAFDAHVPWFCAMRAMLARRGLLEAYFPALLSSVALRLYKDGGVTGVMRGFNAKALPVLRIREMDARRLSLRGKLLYALCACRAYPAVYPILWAFETARRELSYAAFAVRRRKEGGR